MELKRWINYLLAGILLCVFLSTPALAGKTLVVAINPNWPPMEMKDKKGKITGYEIDLIKAMGEAAGFRGQICRGAVENYIHWSRKRQI